MTELNNIESIWPVTLVTILFFLWGFAYGLLEQLNGQFQVVAGLNTTESVALHSAYFGAYFIGPPTIGQLVLRKAGFKMTFICGLCIYSVGTLIFWPSAVLTSFPAFLLSNFINGLGVSILEVSANPFIALCGPLRYAEVRLNITQGVQAIGTVVAPLLAQKVLFAGFSTTESLIDVQWTYLAIALFDVALAVVFYYLPIPEADDTDFEAMRIHSLPEDRRMSADDRRIPRSVYLTLGIAVFSMFTYLGAQEVLGTNFQPYAKAIGAQSHDLTPFDWQTLGYSAFAVGRFVTAALALVIPPYILLGVDYLGVIVLSALALGLRGPAGAASLVIYQLFQGGIFPLIYAMGLRGLGKHTKWGAVALTTAICGGAIWPIGSAGVNKARGYAIGLSVAVAAAVLGAVYPVYLAVNKPARHMVNPKNGDEGREHRWTRRRRSEGKKKAKQEEGRAEGVETETELEKEDGNALPAGGQVLEPTGSAVHET